MQPDPTRPHALTWITSYASIYHKPGVPLFDLCQQGRAGRDPRLVFSWYAADYTTDPDFAGADPETRANPPRGTGPILTISFSSSAACPPTSIAGCT